MHGFNKIVQIWNIIKAIPYLILFYIYANLGHKKYIESEDDIIRVNYSNIYYNYLYKAISHGIGSQVVYLNNQKLNLEEVSIINSNHVHQNDILILFNLFYKNNIDGSFLSSISTEHGICNFDKKILKMSESAMVSNNKKDIYNIVQKFNYWNNRSYSTCLITFFEGIAKKDSIKQSNTLIHLLDPKTLGFSLCVKHSMSKYMYDINIVYTHNNKLLDPKKNNFTLLLFHPNTKVFVEIHKYELPDYKDSIKWIKELYFLKDCQINKMINKIKI